MAGSRREGEPCEKKNGGEGGSAGSIWRPDAGGTKSPIPMQKRHSLRRERVGGKQEPASGCRKSVRKNGGRRASEICPRKLACPHSLGGARICPMGIPSGPAKAGIFDAREGGCRLREPEGLHGAALDRSPQHPLSAWREGRRLVLSEGGGKSHDQGRGSSKTSAWGLRRRHAQKLGPPRSVRWGRTAMGHRKGSCWPWWLGRELETRDVGKG